MAEELVPVKEQVLDVLSGKLNEAWEKETAEGAGEVLASGVGVLTGMAASSLLGPFAGALAGKGAEKFAKKKMAKVAQASIDLGQGLTEEGVLPTYGKLKDIAEAIYYDYPDPETLEVPPMLSRKENERILAEQMAEKEKEEAEAKEAEAKEAEEKEVRYEYEYTNTPEKDVFQKQEIRVQGGKRFGKSLPGKWRYVGAGEYELIREPLLSVKEQDISFPPEKKPLSQEVAEVMMQRAVQQQSTVRKAGNSPNFGGVKDKSSKDTAIAKRKRENRGYRYNKKSDTPGNLEKALGPKRPGALPKKQLTADELKYRKKYKKLKRKAKKM